ncbi:MAG: Fic family protein [Chloroflexi bacterium]|nr:Fic family protein [Chloroflexota bacterium]
MSSFVPGFLERQPITQNILRTVRLLGEYKGKETLFKQQIPQALETLRQVAVIQSTESSNRIEGITASPDRLRALLADKTTPGNRSEQEILGYRDVLSSIHTNYQHMPLTTGIVRQLHRDLYKYMESEGGRWKPVDNEISEVRADGTKVIRFRPVPAFATAEHMGALHERCHGLWTAGEVEKLVLIPAYVLDFLCIHPFLDGNGRMARLLSLLLLYQAGFEVGRYISLEKIVEETRESYYDSLYASSQGWHENEHSLLPWTEYFLGVLVAAYREFESRVGLLATARGAKTEMVLEAIRHLPQDFRMVDVERLCPNVTRDWIRQVFADLKKQGVLWCEGKGPAAVWHKRGSLL